MIYGGSRPEFGGSGGSRYCGFGIREWAGLREIMDLMGAGKLEKGGTLRLVSMGSVYWYTGWRIDLEYVLVEASGLNSCR